MNRNVSLNLYTINKLLIGQVTQNRRLTTESRGLRNDVRHIVIRYQEPFPYLVGQSVGILMDGTDPLTGKPHKLRLYSIASTSKGDEGDGQSVSVCVVRHFWDNPKTGETSVPGLASNYLCDLRPGDKIRMTGPVGRHFLLPEDFKKQDLIFVATGTGIAPYRGMLSEMFDQGAEGEVFLFFGVQYRDVLLYHDEFESYRRCKNFSYFTAISREDKNPFSNEVPTRGNKMYVQAKMYERRGDLIRVLKKPDSLLYLCGLKGMESGIFQMLEGLGREILPSGSFVEKLKAEQRVKVEVY